MTHPRRQATKMNRLMLLSVLLTFAACAKTILLKNGYTQAPANPNFFKNRILFEQSMLAGIDTTVIYEELEDNYYQGLEKQPTMLARHNYKNPNTIYGVYRFYGNGCYNYFSLDRNKPELTSELFDLTNNGWRGVLYTKHNQLKGDLFTQTGQMAWQLGKQKELFTFKDDTLIVELKNVHTSRYIKRHIDPKFLEHRADW